MFTIYGKSRMGLGGVDSGWGSGHAHAAALADDSACVSCVCVRVAAWGAVVERRAFTHGRRSRMRRLDMYVCCNGQ